MSHVDNVLLSFSIIEDSIENDDGTDTYPLMVQINEWLSETYGTPQQFGPDLGDVRGAVGGYKALETPLFAAAFNGFLEDEFLAFLRTLPWRHPDEVQYIVKRQHDERFEIVSPFAEVRR